MIFALTYVSKASEPFEEGDIKALEAQACSKNEILNVTGYLNYKKGNFLQYLEGEEDIILSLMETIREDQRHDIIQIVEMDQINKRRFENCYMRFWTQNELIEIRMDDVIENAILRMSEQVYGKENLRKLILQMVTRMAELHKLHPPRLR